MRNDDDDDDDDDNDDDQDDHDDHDDHAFERLLGEVALAPARALPAWAMHAQAGRDRLKHGSRGPSERTRDV